MRCPMNEERLQEYLNLIEALLICPSGDELVLLNLHSSLIDADLVQAIAPVVKELEQRGDRNVA